MSASVVQYHLNELNPTCKMPIRETCQFKCIQACVTKIRSSGIISQFRPYQVLRIGKGIPISNVFDFRENRKRSTEK